MKKPASCRPLPRLLPRGYGARTRLRNLALALCLAAGPALAEPATLVALGDSLTQGYGLPPEDGLVPQLQRWLDAQGAEVKLVNAGVSGDTTAGGRARLGWTLTPEVDALMIALGGNDLLRGLPPEETRANLEAMLAEAQGRGLPVLLVGLPAPGNYGPDYAAAFDAIWPELAARYDALLVPDMLAPIDSLPPEARAGLVQADGLHPTAAGVALEVEQLGPKLLDLLARLPEAAGPGDGMPVAREPAGTEPSGAEPGGAEPGGAAPGGATSGGAAGN